MADQASGSGAKTRVYVMLPLNIVNSQTNGINYAQTDDERTGKKYEELPATARPFRADLDFLRDAGVEGVMVDCWWGIVEAEGPGQYNWKGYDTLFSIVCDAGLNLHVVMSFHACVDTSVNIPLPNWVRRIGKTEDLFYKDAYGNACTEYLSWAVDQELVLKDRYGNPVSPLQVYENFMSKFTESMAEYFKKSDEDHGITMIEVGLGPSGELRYPAYRFNSPPIGTGAFQCYDKYMTKSWENEAEEQGFTIPCRVGPQTAGSYKSTPDQTQFFQDQDQTKPGLTSGICYWDNYGKAFLTWYSKNLVDHGKRVLQIAKEIFMEKNVDIAAKVPGIHWYCGTENHAAEATAGLFAGDPQNTLSVYESIAQTLESLKATFIFTCAEMKNDPNIATDRPQELVEQVLGVAQQMEVSRACENASPIATKNSSAVQEFQSYNRIIRVAIDYNISYFTYLRLAPELMTDTTRFKLFKKFVQGMNAHTLIESPQ